MSEWYDSPSLPQNVRGAARRHRDFFSGEGPLTLARAPGRLDVMGGIADYSGSVVLEMPLGEAAYALLQPRSDGRVRIRSVPPERESVEIQDYSTTVEALGAGGNPASPEQVASLFTRSPEDRWAAYLAGCWTILAGARPDADLSGGADLLLFSEVPAGAGVSSSAAIEVATMRALAAAHGIEMDGLELARLCQRVENVIVGAPCGIMDQVTSALGREGELLALKCQPHEVLGYHRIPPGYAVTGLDSGVKHSVGGSNYTKARVAAFMGHRILTQSCQSDPLNGYLANLTPDLYWNGPEDEIPTTLQGAKFLEEYGNTIDTVTCVDPEETYHVRSCTEHPIMENDRVSHFITHLEEVRKLVQRDSRRAIRAERLMQLAGSLMYESHASYSENCNLGSEETDFIVEEVRKRGPERGLYGAKITGGGSGGTVAILMRADEEAETALEEVRTAYKAAYGSQPRRFVGSSPGAMAWEPRTLARGQ
ncbi:MAG: GHMP kinase [Armatimonadetes bacterium]|nr:GHMP kinase [Armatimonadota bacterium]